MICLHRSVSPSNRSPFLSVFFFISPLPFSFTAGLIEPMSLPYPFPGQIVSIPLDTPKIAAARHFEPSSIQEEMVQKLDGLLRRKILDQYPLFVQPGNFFTG